jgi:hypothetical protein
MITGGVAAIAYGEPRLTNDVDIVVDGAPAYADRFTAVFSTPDYYLPPHEVLIEELARSRHGHFNIIHNDSGLRADVYVAGDDSLNAWAMQRRHEEQIGADHVWFAPIEYVIVRKLEYYSEGGSDRHLRDIAAMLRISGDLIDRATLRRLIGDRGLEVPWAKVGSGSE